MPTRPLRVAGLISGTSVDGIDAAVTLVDGSDTSAAVVLERFETVPYDPELRNLILRLSRDDGCVSDVARAHVRVGEAFAQAALVVMDEQPADLIGSHGQTIAHVVGEPAARASLQIGTPAVIAARTGLTVVSDFRSADIAAGGQGAPLVPLFDWLVLRHDTRFRVALNIGGIANVTYLPPRSSAQPPIAFDTGPGNALLDRAAWLLSDGQMGCDENGEMASSGQTDGDSLADLRKMAYFGLLPPKSTGREEFGDQLAERVVEQALARAIAPADIMATLTELTARTISAGLVHCPGVEEVVVSGGGAHNPALMCALRRAIPGAELATSDQIGVPVDAKEAMAFALLAYRSMYGLPGNIPSCTGAGYPVVLGSITPGANFSRLARQVWS